MKHISATIISIVFFSFITTANAARYNIDPTHSFIEFKVMHLNSSWLLGRFNKIKGEFTFDETKDEAYQTISVTVDTTSIDSNHAERDKHLRDIINVTNFDKATFTSTKYTGDSNSGIMSGKLTIHGITKNVDIAVKKVGEGKDPWGGYRAGFEGSLTINRKDFGIEKDLGEQSWNTEIMLYIEGTKNKAVINQ